MFASLSHIKAILRSLASDLALDWLTSDAGAISSSLLSPFKFT